jgi:TolA-binding protein
MLPLITSIPRRRRPVLGLLLLAGLLCATPVRADEADDQFAVAAGHYARQRWKLAVVEFEEFLQKYPDHPQAHQGLFFLAEAQLQVGDFSGAESHFREYLRREPGDQFARPALFRAGEAAYLTGKTDLAKADLERFRSAYPQDKLNAYVLPYLGDIALSKGDVAAAAQYFRDGLKQFPQGRLQDDCRFGLARALQQQDQNPEAERLYLAVAAKVGSPLADDAQFRLGALQYATGKYAEAIETFAAFETRLGQSPWRSNARLGRGWALLKLKRLDEARPAFESITSDPKVGIDARYWLGLVQKAQGHWAAAAETLLAAAAAAGDHELAPAIRFHAGDALLRAGDLKAAAEQFDKVIASGTARAGHRPKVGPEAWSERSTAANEWIDDAMRGKVQVALQAGDYQTLDRQADEFENRFPDGPLKRDVQRMRARSLIMRKQHGPALKLLEPLVAAGGSGEEALEDQYLLALAYQGLDRHQDALAALLPVLDSAEGRLKSDAQLVQGSLLLAMHRYGEAIGPLEAFLASLPSAGQRGAAANGETGDGEVRGRGELAICYARSGRLDKAKQAYAKLLEEYPRHKLLCPTTEQLAEAAYEAGDPAWSTQLYLWLTTESGSKEHELKGMTGLGWSQWKGGRLAEAAVTFEKLLESNPPDAIATEAAMVRGQILEQLDQSDPALAMYDLVIDKYPKSREHPQALLAAARLRDKLQQDRQAAALYHRLATEYPQTAELDAVLYQWAWVLSDLGQAAESSALFERLHKEHPQSRYWADATYRLARQAFAEKDYWRAGELVSEVLAGHPDAGIREHGLYLQGQIAAAREDWDQVETAFTALAKEFPESPSRLVAAYWVAETAYRRRDYEAAGKLLEGLAQRTQGHHDAWLAMVPLRRAQVLAQLSKWSDAYAIASKIEAAYPDFEQQYEVDYLIGRCLASRADFQGARDAYLKVIRSPAGAKTETAAMAQWMIGETYFHQKNYEAALREYLKVEILYAYPTWQAAALLQAGKCRDLLGESKEADRLYARLMDEHPGTEFAQEAARRMTKPPGERGGGDRPD